MAEAEELVKELRGSWWITGRSSLDIRNELVSKGDKAIEPVAGVLKDKGQPAVAREGAALVLESMTLKGTAGRISQKNKEVMVDAIAAGLNDADFSVYSACARTLTLLAEKELLNSLDAEAREKAVKGLVSITFKENLGGAAVEGMRKTDYSDIPQGTRKQAIDALNRFIDRHANKDAFWADRAAEVIKKIEKAGRWDVSAGPAKEKLEKSIEGKDKKVKKF